MVVIDDAHLDADHHGPSESVPHPGLVHAANSRHATEPCFSLCRMAEMVEADSRLVSRQERQVEPPLSRPAAPGKSSGMNELLIGYARVSTYEQDLTAQRIALESLGVDPAYIFTDHGLTGTNRARPGLREALAACRNGDTLVVATLDRWLGRFAMPKTSSTN